MKNQAQVVVDTSLLYVHILPETREKQTARNVGGNYKKHLFWFVFVTRLRSILTVSGMPAVTPTERGTWTQLADTWVDVFGPCSCLVGQEELCVSCREQHTDYSLVKLCSLKKACYRCRVGQLLWRDAAVLFCTMGIIFGEEHGLASSGRITLVWVMPCWHYIRTKAFVKFCSSQMSLLLLL